MSWDFNIPTFNLLPPLRLVIEHTFYYFAVKTLFGEQNDAKRHKPYFYLCVNIENTHRFSIHDVFRKFLIIFLILPCKYYDVSISRPGASSSQHESLVTTDGYVLSSCVLAGQRKTPRPKAEVRTGSEGQNQIFLLLYLYTPRLFVLLYFWPSVPPSQSCSTRFRRPCFNTF